MSRCVLRARTLSSERRSSNELTGPVPTGIVMLTHTRNVKETPHTWPSRFV